MKNIIKKILVICFPNEVIRKLRLVRFCHSSFYKNFASDVLSSFLIEEEMNNINEVKKIKVDIYDCLLRYGCNPIEYFLYGFRYKNRLERSTFLTDSFRENYLARVEGLDLAKHNLDNKYNFYHLNQQFFLREVIYVPDGGGNYEEFKALADKKRFLFIKANIDSCGRSAFLADLYTEELIYEQYKKLVSRGIDWIIEELIIQTPEMAEWNESSVNTIRIPTFLTSKGFFVLTPTFRTGRRGSVVDNAGAGGIIANIDMETGVINTNGVDEQGYEYKRHPDSNKQYMGWQVPLWKELLVLVEKVHKTTMREHIYIGWDFALTKNGWCVVEGNWGQMINQYADKIGRKEEFIRYMNYGRK